MNHAHGDEEQARALADQLDALASGLAQGLIERCRTK